MSDIDDPSIKRRLSAILFADIANYTRLMGDDEVATWRAAKPVIRNMNDLARQHNGRVLQVRGDGLFLLFDSAVDAVRFGIELQRQMKAINESLEDERQLWFRVGINLGEVLVDGDDVSGDSVNIAARLESLARPGHVCISAAVYEQVRNRLTFGYEYLGAQYLKNVKEPVDAFQVHENPSSAAMTAGLSRPNLADSFIHQPIKDLSVVVLPFRFQGSDQTESWLADGLTEDITTSLSRFHDFFVISRMSAYAFAARMRSPADAERGRSIWGEHYDRALEDIFDVQDQITRLIVSATAVQIEASERERIRQLAPANLRAYGFVVQGQQHIFRYTRDDNREARLLYEAALQVDPRYARAL